MPSSSWLHGLATETAPWPGLMAATDTESGAAAQLAPAGRATAQDRRGASAPAAAACERWQKEGHAIMVSVDLDQCPSAGLASDFPRWRDRLEGLWRRQVEEIIELSLAYHEAASAGRGGGGGGAGGAGPPPGPGPPPPPRAAPPTGARG